MKGTTSSGRRGRQLLARAGLLVLAGALALASGQQAPVARFHHVHYAVADPAAAMASAVTATDGVRVIVPGLGVGVRTGREFMLFDRAADEPAASAPGSRSAMFSAAASRLRAAGFDVDPPAASGSRALHTLAALAADHLAFSVDDLTAGAGRLEADGARVLSRSDDAVLFDAGEGVRIELLRDTDREERFWCPMHPGVRSADPGKCPLCAMDLVAIPPPRIGEYGLDVMPERDPRDGTVRALRFRVREPGTNAAVSDLQIVHERTFHLFIVSRDLDFFEHVHPERQPDGSYELRQPLPSGEYMLIADFLPAGGTSQMVQRALISGRRHVSRMQTPTLDGAARSVTKEGITVTLDAEPARAGREVPLTFTVTDAKTGEAVTDLQPYLGAPAHMLIVRADLTDALHAHPEEVVTGGPAISFHPLLPGDGAYKLWLQVQRSGRVITVPFVLRTGK